MRCSHYAASSNISLPALPHLSEGFRACNLPTPLQRRTIQIFIFDNTRRACVRGLMVQARSFNFAGDVGSNPIVGRTVKSCVDVTCLHWCELSSRGRCGFDPRRKYQACIALCAQTPSARNAQMHQDQLATLAICDKQTRGLGQHRNKTDQDKKHRTEQDKTRQKQDRSKRNKTRQGAKQHKNN